MKVSIIPEKCIACGLCQTYSNRFDYHDDGIVKFADSDLLEQTFPDSDKDTFCCQILSNQSSYNLVGAFLSDL